MQIMVSRNLMAATRGRPPTWQTMFPVPNHQRVKPGISPLPAITRPDHDMLTHELPVGSEHAIYSAREDCHRGLGV